MIGDNFTSAFSNVSGIPTHNIELWSIPYFIGGVAVILLNLLTLMTYAINTYLRRRTVYLLLSLCVADTLVGITMVTYALSIINRKYVPFQPLMDTFEGVPVFDMFSSIASFQGLVFISIERAFATNFPLHFRNLSNRPYYIGIVIQWLYAFVSIPLFSMKRTIFLRYVAFYSLTLGLTVICISYVSIFVRVKRQHRLNKQDALPRAQTRERELAKTLCIVTAISLLTWLPDAIETIIYGELYNFYYSIISTLLRYSNSLVNSIVYLLRLKDFRRALLRLLRTCSRDKPLFVNPTGNTGIGNGTLTLDHQKGFQTTNVVFDSVEDDVRIRNETAHSA